MPLTTARSSKGYTVITCSFSSVLISAAIFLRGVSPALRRVVNWDFSGHRNLVKGWESTTATMGSAGLHMGSSRKELGWL